MSDTKIYKRISHEDLPQTLPIFPLSGVLLLPYSFLPLNIFEERYLALIDDCLKADRMFGMIQPKPQTNNTSLYDVGCAGKIISFSETADGRYLITLDGICRFNVKKELDTTTPYRRIQPDWEEYTHDLDHKVALNLNREKLSDLLERYFQKEDIQCDWDIILNADDQRVISALAMLCPFGASEKQALLEVSGGQERADLFMTILEMAVMETNLNDVPY